MSILLNRKHDEKLSQIRLVFCRRGSARFFLAAFPVRLGISMMNMGLVWFILGETGSILVAGLVTASFATSEAVVGPQVAKLIDKFGQTRVVPVLGWAYALALTALAVCVRQQYEPWVLVVMACCVGSSIPQIGALSMARWSYVLRDDKRFLPTAFSLEAMSNEFSFLVGPAISVMLSTLIAPQFGVAVAGILIVFGCLIFVADSSSAPSPKQIDTHVNGVKDPMMWKDIGFVVLMFTNFSLGVYFGSLQIGLSGFASENSIGLFAGVLYGITSGAGLIGGFIYAQTNLQTALHKQLWMLLLFVSLACVPMPFVENPMIMAINLAIAGFAVAPIMAVAAALVSNNVSDRSITVAFTWTNSASVAGIALSSSFSGAIVNTFGSQVGLAIPAIIIGCAALLTNIASAKSVLHRTPAN